MISVGNLLYKCQKHQSVIPTNVGIHIEEGITQALPMDADLRPSMTIFSN